MSYTRHYFQDGQVLTGALLDEVDEKVYDLDEEIEEVREEMQGIIIVESGTVTLTNTLAFPFNNSKTTVALQKTQANSKYVIVAEPDTFSGNVGEIVVSNRMTNGFAIQYTGSASSVTIKYFVIGGFEE